MFLRSSLSGLIFTLSTVIAGAQTPIVLSDYDVYLQTRLEKKHSPGSVGLCGFTILGNHRSRMSPRVEWDLNIDELTSGETQVVGITAGTFDVLGHTRTARSPIVEMSFVVEGEAEPIRARIVGSPNADNAITAMLDTQPASMLFTAFSNTKLITIELHYADHTEDVLQVRGWHDARKFGGGKNSFFNECLRGLMPRVGVTKVTPIP